jgi:hypothetical protein
MIDKSTTHELITKYKSIFKNLKPILSPATNEIIYFNMTGFKHLVFKGKHRREKVAIYNRLVLIPLIIPVLRNSEEIIETRVRNEYMNDKKVKVTYLALEAYVGKDSVRVRVIVRKIGEKGHFYFYSVMKY